MFNETSLRFLFHLFIFQITNSHLSQPSPFWSLQQLSPYTLSVCVRNIRYLFSPSVSKYQNIEDVSHFTTQNFTSTEHYTQRYIHFNAFQFSQKVLSKCNCFIRKSEHSYVTMVLTVANQYVYTLTVQSGVAHCAPKWAASAEQIFTAED